MGQNNFNIIRLLAALFVLLCHSYGFFGKYDPIRDFTHGAIPGGQLAVYVFFILSGYLITASWMKKENIRIYLEHRIRRIFPALIIVVLFSMLIVGPLFTTYSFGQYFSSPQTYGYLINLSLCKLKTTLPGVFIIDGKEHTVNDPLWTLVFEFLMYILVAVFGLFKLFDKNKNGIYFLMIFLPTALIASLIQIPKDLFILKIGAATFVKLFIFFFAGSFYYIYFKEKKPSLLVVLLLFEFTLITRSTPLFFLPAAAFIVTGVFYIAFLGKVFGNRITSKGDFSYGTYLYGFIFQNILIILFGPILNPFSHFLLTVLFTLPFAIASWKLVESRFLKRSV